MVTNTPVTIDDLIIRAEKAMEEIKDYDQKQADRMVHAIAVAIYNDAEELAKNAAEETQIVEADSYVGMIQGFMTELLVQTKGKKSVGEIERDEQAGVIKVAHPAGIVANITPVTTPVSGPAGNGMLALKGRNAVIVSPSPRSKNSSRETVELMRKTLKEIGAPEDLVQIVPEPSKEASGELMAKSDFVIATGGPGLVKAAYSSGTPAFGVGAGNAQLILDETDNLDKFAEDTIAGRLFHSAGACTNTQTLLYPEETEADLKKAFADAGIHWIEDEQIIEKIRNVLFDENGNFYSELFGQPIEYMAEKFDITIPEGTKVIAVKTDKYGEDEVLAQEKPVPVLNVYPYKTFDEALEAASTNLKMMGQGHGSAIYTNDEDKALKAANSLKVSRFAINQPTTATNNGAENSFPGALSMGCGYWGGNSSNEWLSFKHMLNIQRVGKKIKPEPIPEDIWEFED